MLPRFVRTPHPEPAPGCLAWRRASPRPLGTLLSAPAYAANPVTPGNFTGLGFDQCEAPSQTRDERLDQEARRSAPPASTSPANSRGLPRADQPDPDLGAQPAGRRLAPDADHARAAGVVLHPLPALRQEHRPDDQPEHRRTATRRPAPRAGPRPSKAVGAAQRPRHRRRQHDLLRPRGLRHPQEHRVHVARRCGSCSAWTDAAARLRVRLRATTPAPPPASGCSTTRGSAPSNPITLPDQIWIADWNGQAEHQSSTYIRSDGWQPYRRIKQYQGGHNETWGGVTINIDRNYLNLRTPKLPGSSAARPRHRRRRRTPAPRRPTPGARPRRSAGRAYRKTGAGTRHRPDRPAAVPAQAAAAVPLRGHRDAGTGRRSRPCTGFQRSVGHPLRTYVTRG